MYAVATVKFLDSKYFLPTKQLETISSFSENTAHEGKTQIQPNKILDSLYIWILGQTFDSDNPVVYYNFRSILGTVVVLINPLPPSAVAKIVGLETKEAIL